MCVPGNVMCLPCGGNFVISSSVLLLVFYMGCCEAGYVKGTPQQCSSGLLILGGLQEAWRSSFNFQQSTI